MAHPLFGCMPPPRACWQQRGGDRVGLLPERRWCHAEVLLDKTAEIGWRRELEHVGNLCESEVALAEQAADVYGGEAVYPVVGGLSADALADFGEVFGRDEEPVGIPRHFTVLDIVAFVEQHHEAADDGGVLFGNRLLVVVQLGGAEIKVIEKQGLRATIHNVVLKTVVILVVAVFHVAEIHVQPLKLLLVQAHDRILEQGERAPYAIVVSWRAIFEVWLRDIDALCPEVGGWLHVFQQPLHGDDHAALWLKSERPSVEKEIHLPLVAQDVGHPVVSLVRAKPAQVVIYGYV